MPLLSLPADAPLTVGESPSPFGMVNRPPNNVWGDIQSDEQIIAGMDAADSFTFDDRRNLANVNQSYNSRKFI